MLGARGVLSILMNAELFLDAGIDMTKEDAYKPMIKRANEYMQEMEKILNKKKANSS